jgi:hypothetical protein
MKQLVKVNAINVSLNICQISKVVIKESKNTIIRLGLVGYLEAPLTVVAYAKRLNR